MNMDMGLFKSSFLHLFLLLLPILNEVTSFRLRDPSHSHQKSIDNALDFEIDSNGQPALLGHLGLYLPSAIGQASLNCDESDIKADQCFQYGDYARVYLTRPSVENNFCARVEWHSNFARRLEDCYDLQEGVHWYGGFGQKFVEAWPIESISRQESAVVSGGFWEGADSGGNSENYWILTSGPAIHVDEDFPFFFSLNRTERLGMACFVAQNKYPYRPQADLRLKYDICTGGPGETFLDVHKRTLRKYYELPTVMADEGMLVKPYWSTWAEYKEDVNQKVVLELAQRVLAEGFLNSSHVQIDDNWESCYGEFEFNSTKFPDPAAMSAQLKAMGLRLTLWAHPFINRECPSFEIAMERGYFVKDEKGKLGLVHWWQSNKEESGLIDFTNPEAVQWWSARLERLRTEYGIDSFKFDAGEVKDMPYSYQLTGNENDFPNLITIKYVEACAAFGNMIEVRVGRHNQKQPIFNRMVDKGSHWGYDGGLGALIPALLDYGIKGYPYVLPDMIGGNAYGDRPSKELFIRWMQVNSFMPSVQFSLLPWGYDQETVDIVKHVLALRQEYSAQILQAAHQTIQDGSPINRPIFWVDPLDPVTHTIDDQYMLGDNILIAPVVIEGATSRDIYLPKGRWTFKNDFGLVEYEGPILLQNFSAPLDKIVFFVRAESTQ